MKLAKLALVSTLVGISSNAAAGSASSSNRGGKDESSGRLLSEIHNRVLEEDKSGTFVISESDDGKPNKKAKSKGKKEPRHQTMNVELEDGLIYTLTNVDPSWTESESGKGLKSGKDKIKIGKGAIISGGEIDLQGGAPEDSEGEDDWDAGGRRLGDEPRRRLQSSPTLGDKTLLVVRIVAANAETEASEEVLSDEIFGTNGDPFNFVSQYKACSYNQLNFRKTSYNGISNGVITVSVPITTSEGDAIMKNAVTDRITTMFGTSPKNIANHVVYCLPPGTMSGRAYAYINHWLSIYSNNWCMYPTSLLHEVGHNLGFAHSREGGVEYGDQSGMMGYFYSQDNGPAMCFNGAKSWQSEWYKTATRMITPTVGANTCFNGALYGVADFDVNDSAKTIVLKINDHRNGEQDFFVAFNRQTGINSGTVEWGDQVLVTTTGEEGMAYSRSTLLAKLNAGQSYSINNFAGTNDNMVITVKSIDTASNPGFAQVLVQFEGAEPCGGSFAPTESPSMKPTQSCDDGKIVWVDVTTDNYPGETSWTLRNTCNGAMVERVDMETLYTEPRTEYSHDYCVPNRAYEFTINDKFGDGMCCSYGSGSYSVKFGGMEVASGGNYGTSESTSFGNCEGNPITPRPTPLPTPSPTKFDCPSVTRKRLCRNQPTCTWKNGRCI